MLVPIWMGICMASLGEVAAYLLPLIYQILDFIYWTVLIYIYLFWMTWHWKPAIVFCATTVFVSITQRASPPRCVTILPMEPLYYSLLVRQLIMPSFLLPTLTSTEGRNMGSCRGLWFLNEQSLQSTVSTVSLSLNLQWKSVLPDSNLSIWSQFKNVRPLPFRIVALAFVTYLQNDSIGDLQFLWER